MALDPQIDPALAAQLYGLPAPGLADMAPAQAEDPWGWVPDAWKTSPEDEELRRQQQLGPGGMPQAAPEVAVPQQPGLGVPAPAVDAALAAPAGPPDAITGAAPLPTVADLHGYNMGMAPPPTAADEAYANPLAMRDNGPLAPTPAFGDEQVNAAVDQIALHGGPRLEQMAVDREVARRAKLAADTARIETENLRQAQGNLEAHTAAAATAQAKSDQIVAEAMDLANRKTNPDRLVRSMSGGQTIAELIALATGALIAGRTGGPNVAMDLLQKRIDRDIDAQKQDVENMKFGLQARRGAVADEYARHGDLYRAGEVVRLATYQSAFNTMAAEQQNFDPRGFQAIERGKVMQQWAARAQQSSEAQRKTIFDEELKVIKAGQEAREQKRKEIETQATIAHQKATTALGYAQLSSAAADRKAARDARLDDKATERADKEAERDRQFTLSPPRPTIELDSDGKPVIGPDGKPVSSGQKKFTNADGKPWMLGDPEDRRAMKGQIVAAAEITDMIDEVNDIRENIGKGVIPWSAARQRLKLLEDRMTLVRKGGTQGMSSDKDFDSLRGSIGAKDLTSFIDQSAGLKEARDRTTGELNTAMRVGNYTGPAITFANKHGAKAEDTIEDIRLQKLLEKPDETIDQARAQIESGRAQGFDVGRDSDATVEQQIGIQRLGLAAAGPRKDAAAIRARAGLQTIAAEGPTGSLQRRAKAALEAALRAGVGSQEPTTTSTAPNRPAVGDQSYATPIPDELKVP